MSQLSGASLAKVGTDGICANIPGLTKRQRRLCLKHADIMPAVARAAFVSVAECQWQFRGMRWNCSTISDDWTVFGKSTLSGKSDYSSGGRSAVGNLAIRQPQSVSLMWQKSAPGMRVIWTLLLLSNIYKAHTCALLVHFFQTYSTHTEMPVTSNSLH